MAQLSPTKGTEYMDSIISDGGLFQFNQTMRIEIIALK